MGATAYAILVICSVAVCGHLVGTIRVRGIGLGAAGVLFAGILFGHFGATIDHEIAHFAKELGLVLFVFTIGLQLGPGIVHLWRQRGLLLNGFALAIVLQGVLLVIAFDTFFGLGVFAATGLFSGATTNTPSLGAAQQAGAMLQNAPGDSSLLASAYAVAYPGAILGIIGTMLVLRRVLGINIESEAAAIRAEASATDERIDRRSVLVENKNLAGVPFGSIPGVEETGIRIARIKRSNESGVHPATDETDVQSGDLVQVVGTKTSLDRFTPVLGKRSDVNLMTTTGDAETRKIVVTEPRALNKPLKQLALDHTFHVSVTRIRRGSVEMAVRGSSRFFYGDVANLVGNRESLEQAAEFLGNQTRKVNETQFAPVFLGIALGIGLGSIPFTIPGVPFPVRLGLAGGPLIAAIICSLIGSLGKVVWYIPHAANLSLREMGIILFLACAGLSAGETFFAVALTTSGLTWMLVGLLVTTIPLLTTALVARLYFRQNYLTICGVVAGSMTDPPALAFANTLSETDACSTAYAAVYPLTMILRIIAAQSLIFILA